METFVLAVATTLLWRRLSISLGELIAFCPNESYEGAKRIKGMKWMLDEFPSKSTVGAHGENVNAEVAGRSSGSSFGFHSLAFGG